LNLSRRYSIISTIAASPNRQALRGSSREGISSAESLILLLLALLALLDSALIPRLAPQPSSIWDKKPLLGYFVLTQSLSGEIERKGVLSERQLWLSRQVAQVQEEQLALLEQESLPVVLDASLTLEEKRQRINDMGYNRRVGQISLTSQQLLAMLLPARDYYGFAAWVEARWHLERQLHGLPSLLPNSPSLLPNSPSLLPNSPSLLPNSPSLIPNSHSLLPNSPSLIPNSHSLLPNSPSLLPNSPSLIPNSHSLLPNSPSLIPDSQFLIPNSPLPSARSYKIFATRYDSGDRYAVALPDMCLKFSNAGNRLCADDGYQINQGYFVYLSYDGETAAEVWESGPWNVDDNYWSTSGDPQPRRMFADLPAGMPEAQAAFFDGYNGGVDQYGRVVTAPFGIDLGRQVSIDIGLEPGNNDWINITFAWTEGWDKARSSGASQPPQQGDNPTAAPTIPPLVTATPNPDGSLVHEVQPGQALWSIAIAYGVTLQDLYTLNGLSEGAVIQPGEKLLVRQGLPTPTVTLTLTPTVTLPPTVTRLPATFTPSATSTLAQAETTTPEASAPEATPALDPVLLLIAGGAVLGAILILLGVLFRRK
jgi:LysM repeat protein